MQKLVVKKFRQISDATIEIPNLLVLIGEQASGKSTIAKLIHFFKSLKQDYLDIISHIDSINPADVQTSMLNSIRDKFASYFGFTTRYSKDFEIVYYFSETNDLSVRLSKSKSLQVTFSENMWALIYESAKDALIKRKNVREKKYASFLMQDKAEQSLGKQLTDNASEVFADKKDSLFIPAGRNITVSYPEQFQLLFYGGIGFPSNSKALEVNTVDTNLMKEFFSYSKFLVDYYSDKAHEFTGDNPVKAFALSKIEAILQGKYSNDEGKEKLVYDSKNYVPLNLSSSGQQESIRIIQDLAYVINEKESTSRIIEEPETHLFPSAQAALVQLFVLASNYTNSQVIVTTHSPFILTAFNNLLYYNKVMSENADAAEKVRNVFGTLELDMTKQESISIQPSNFQAYALKVGQEDYCKSIFDTDAKMISDNYIDEASEALYADFEYLYSII